MIPTSRKRLVYLRNYIITVIIAAAVLIVLRWDTVEGVSGVLNLVSLCIWQAIVWPLYLIKLMFTP